MATSDLTTPTPVSCFLAAKPISSRVPLCIPVFLIFSYVVMDAAHCFAQDVAEAAKQERARKQSQLKKPRHVYTDEDLKRAQILTPEDRAELQAQKNPAAPAADGSVVAREAGDTNVAPQLDNPPLASEAVGFAVIPNFDALPLPPGAPLGDVARHFRQLKLSQALQRSAEFHLPSLEAPVLASPKRLQPLGPALPMSEPTPPAPDFSASSSPHLKASSPRRSPLPPSLQPSRPALAVPSPTRPRFAPSQPIVKRSPFARPPASVFASPRLTPSQPLAAPADPSRPSAVHVAPATPAASIAKPHTEARVVPAPSAGLNVITVQPGDSLWKLAEQNLGQGLRWHDLLAVNPGILNPNHIIAGAHLYLPVTVTPLGVAPSFTVRHGDTLWGIAQAQLGRASAWSCIAQANPAIRDANRIYPGQSLILPASCKR